MISGHCFKRLRRGRPSHTPSAGKAQKDFKALLACDVVERFARLSHRNLTAVPLDLSEPRDAEDPAANPGHPACAPYAGSDYCRESWQLHLAELKRRPETHWHKCDHDRLCAIVPIVYQDRCLAAIKLACPASMGAQNFARQVKLLDRLVKEFVISNADSLARLMRAQAEIAESGEAPPEHIEEDVLRRPSHPRIVKAIRSIEAHLADPGLTVARLADELQMDPSYLGHLFVSQVGQRMSRFITARRMAQAKNLLVTTDWQIKRVAAETGHANANWFCCVFRIFTGLTPGAYQRRWRDQSRTLRKR